MAFSPQDSSLAGSKTTSLDFSKSLNSKLMETRERFASVYLEQPKYNVLSQMMDLLAPAKQVNQRKYERSSLGSIGISFTTASAVIAPGAHSEGISGQNYKVSFVSGNVAEANKLRKGDVCRIVTSGVAKLYYVASEKDSDDAVVFTRLNSGSPAAGDIAVTGTTITVLYDSHENDFSQDDKKPIFYTPTANHNFTGVCRDSVHISRDALYRGTFELWDGQFWSFAQEKLMKMRFAKQYEQKLLLGERFSETDGNIITRSTSGGILWWIKNHGQTFEKTTDFDLDDINDIVYNIITVAAAGTSEIVVLCGAYFLKRFQEEAANKYIQYVGTANTLGGAGVRGISVFEYNVLGVSVKFVHYPAWDDPKLFPGLSTTLGGVLKSSANALFLDMSDVESTDGVIPGFEKFYYGDKDMYYTYVPGMIGVQGADPSNAAQLNYNMSASSKDGFSAHIMCDDGYYVNAPERHCFYEYTGA